MDWLQQLDLEKFLLFTLVLTRVSGLTMTAPIYGTNDVPMQVRALLAVALALLITPTQWHVAVEYPRTTINYLVFIGGELIIGLCLGLGIVILFSGIQLAGQLVGRIGGLMLADVFDPGAEESVPVFSRLLFLVTLAVFVCIGGHRMVMAGLLDTFQTIPPGSGAPADSIAEALVVLVSQSFSLAIRASVPVVTALLLSTLVMGLISRTLPQLNILMVGFGMNSMLCFATFSLTLGAAAYVFQEQVEPALEILLDALHAPLQVQWLS
jgi:flagellar biosynthetic protein FliR